MGCTKDCDNKTEFGYCRSTACTNPKYNGSGTYTIGNPMEQRSEPTMNDSVMVATGVAGRIDGYAPVTICGVPIDEAVKMLVEYQSIKRDLAEKIKECAACGIQFSTKIKTLEARLAAEKARADAAENAVNDLIYAATTKAGICRACANTDCSRFGKGCGGVNFKWRGEKGKGAE